MSEFKENYVKARDFHRMKIKMAKHLFDEKHMQEFGKYAPEIKRFESKSSSTIPEALGRCVGALVADITPPYNYDMGIAFGIVNDRLEYENW